MGTYSMFEFVSAMFDKKRYANCTDSDKKEHFFMTMRAISVLYPLEINSYNVIGINQVAVLDYWHFILSSHYRSQPRQIFIPTKKADKIKPKISKIKKEVIDLYIKIHKVKTKDFEFMVSINEDFVYQQLKDIEKDLKESKEYFANL